MKARLWLSKLGPVTGGEGGAGEPLVPQYLADQLTIFQLEKGRLSPPITTGIPNVFNFSATLHKVSIQWALRGFRGLPPCKVTRKFQVSSYVLF